MVQQFRERAESCPPLVPTKSTTSKATTNKNISNRTLLQLTEKVKFPTQSTTPNEYLTSEAKCRNRRSNHKNLEKVRRVAQRNLFDKLAETLHISEDVSFCFLSLY